MTQNVAMKRGDRSRLAWILASALALVSALYGMGTNPRAARAQDAAGVTGANAGFTRQVLALSATGHWRCLDGDRSWLVQFYERLAPAGLPRYAGAGNTSVHKAILEAERLIIEGKRLEGFSLLIELRRDLTTALATGAIEPLMDMWNRRYPSDNPVDLLLSDIEAFLRYVTTLLLRAGPPAEPDAFSQSWREAIARDLQAALRESGYGSVEDMLEAHMAAGQMETVCRVKLRERWAAVFGSGELSVSVRGRPSVSALLAALDEQYPRLRDRSWGLLIYPPLASADDTVLPEHELTLIDPIQESGPYWTWGPANQSIWAMPLLITLFVSSQSPEAGIAVAVASFGLTVYGAAHDFYGAAHDHAFRRGSRPSLWVLRRGA